MDADRISLELLDHFDRPKLLSPLESVRQLRRQPPALPRVSEGAGSFVLLGPPAEPGAGVFSAIGFSRLSPSRDVRWILKWAAAIAVVTVSASQLVAFAYVCVADRALNLAARAGAAESILPRATYQSIYAAVERRLADYPRLGSRLQMTVLQNGRPVGQRFRAREDDRISITISASASAMMPGWLTTVPQWRGDLLLTARADRTMRGHRLRPEHSQTAAE
jgi:hypothetical protein